VKSAGLSRAATEVALDVTITIPYFVN